MSVLSTRLATTAPPGVLYREVLPLMLPLCANAGATASSHSNAVKNCFIVPPSLLAASLQRSRSLPPRLAQRYIRGPSGAPAGRRRHQLYGADGAFAERKIGRAAWRGGG